MGVDVRLEAAVDRVSQDAVALRDGTVIPTETTVWTAGVVGDPRASQWGLPTASGGRVEVLPTLQVADHPEIYVIGDLAHFEVEGQPLPMVAPVAIQQGVAAAENVSRAVTGEPPVEFRYRDPGMMATIGRNAAVVRLGSWTFTGFPAWVLWLGVHLVRLIGFRNRLLVLVNWAWDYFLFERAIRLILPKVSARPPGLNE
jgi:NADH dehydrogenase